MRLTKDEARDAIECWSRIRRAEKVGFPVPAKWLRHGRPPTSAMVIVQTCMDAHFADVSEVFNRDSPLLKYLR